MLFATLIAQLKASLQKRSKYNRLVAEIASLSDQEIARRVRVVAHHQSGAEREAEGHDEPEQDLAEALPRL